MTDKLLANLEAISIAKLFQKVVRHNKGVVETDPGAMIETRLVLANGVELEGSPLRVDASKNAVVSTGSGLGYLNVGTISVLEILDAQAAAALLTNEPPPPSAPIVPASSPPRKDLRDELAKVNTKMAAKFRLEIKADVIDDPDFGDVGKNQFVEFLEMTEHALTSIGEDPVGEIEIGSLEQISIIQAAGQLAVERSGPVMVIAAPFGEPFEKTLSAQLQTELQRNL